MLHNVDIEQWLSHHSENVVRTDRELLFQHSGGDNSVLLLRSGFENQRTIHECPPLASFYERYAGGYIGKGFLLIGTAFRDSVTATTGIIVPSLAEIKSISESGGISFDSADTPFMTTGYMFVYSLSRDARFRCHDRDFKTVTEGGEVRSVLDDWWKMKIADE